MGRNRDNHSESLMRVQGGSPRRRSPSLRERSPGRHKMSDRSSSLGREKQKHSNRAKSPKHTVSRSPSPRSRRLMRVQDERESEKVAQRGSETNHGRGSNKEVQRERSRSPITHSPSPRTKRLKRCERDDDKTTEKHHERNNGKGVEKGQHSPISQSSSPRLNRLRRAEAEKDSEYATERKHEKNPGKGRPRERSSDWETGSGRKERRPSDREFEGGEKERRSGRDEASHKSSRTRREQSTSPLNHSHKSRHRSHSPQSINDSRARDEVSHARGAEHSGDDDDPVAKMKAAEEALQAKEKQKPSFELSGKLAAETNRFRGVTLLFNEPPDARKPDIRWRLYVFKAGEVLKEPLYIHRQTCYLFGRERRVADIPTDHPSCSKQHAVIQFRQVEKEQPDGTLSKQVRPYLMDLGSTNKTFLNDNPIEPQRYYELFEKDTIKFGNSSREYVLLHENSVN